MFGLIFKLFHLASTFFGLCHLFLFRPIIKLIKRKITKKCEIYRMIERESYEGLSF